MDAIFADYYSFSNVHKNRTLHTYIACYPLRIFQTRKGSNDALGQCCLFISFRTVKKNVSIQSGVSYTVKITHTADMLLNMKKEQENDNMGMRSP